MRTWLVGILARQAARCVRGRVRRRALPLDALGEGSDEGRPEIQTPSPSGRLDARMDLVDMLATLSPEHREVIVLRELEGMSYDDMAGVLGVPRGTVESRLFRARGRLRERWRDYLS